MHVNFKRLRDTLIIEIAGAVDRFAAGRLHDAVNAAIRSDCTHLVVDLSGATSLTRAGIRGLVVGARLMRNRHSEFLVNVPDPVMRSVLEATGFADLQRAVQRGTAGSAVSLQHKAA
ncbi:MAG: STAS domain-containing protein [Alphaproteobacteria bacterium]|nr:STAS domain-containing protein [Alphaproteobacteria bacterium]MBU1548682.1 STAS domain-containing protein [Alphaproteobacteria bacterium]MBU2335508.1 STAS domain-containing protein [Alphaproteobacteria bacterium]MBU2391097.1 STAS domain-containing protein [Alphaproteobacteria bacterium]|tara:strand:+ start:3398 stop:3748 length:351 start_codon:yes stop_codon:yes gene_type:complete